MKNYIKLGTLSLIASAILVGCGSSTTTSSNPTTSNSNSSSSNLETGYFIDAPVEGLAYETASGEKGTTDKFGRFKYKHGEKVKFKIGKLSLGEATPDQEGLVTPESIAENDSDLKIQLLRILQALDSDNNPSNGITISSDVVQALASITQEITVLELKDDSAILKVNSDLADILDKDYDGHIDVDKDKAEEHFQESIAKWESGNKPDDNHNEAQEHGQSTQQSSANSEEQHGNGAKFDASQYATSILTQDVKDALAYMGNEERLAYDVYMNLYNYHLENGEEIKQFYNIATRSEIKHVGIVQDLVRKYNLNPEDTTNVENPVATKDIAFEDMPMGKYDVASIQELYDTLYAKGIQSTQDALEVGCMVEVTDVNDLKKWIAKAQEAGAEDILDGFDILINGSYNHYWAFDKGLKNMGVSEGCGVLGADYKKDYPQNEKDHGEEGTNNGGNGKGKGTGKK